MAIELNFGGNATEFTNAADNVVKRLQTIASESKTTKEAIQGVFIGSAGGSDKQLNDAIAGITRFSSELEKLGPKLANVGKQTAIPKVTKEFDMMTASVSQLQAAMVQEEATSGRLTQKYRDLATQAAKLTIAQTNATNATKLAVKANTELNAGLDKTYQIGALAGANIISFGQILSDLPYGIRGVANNLQQMTMTFVTLTVTTGGLTGALKAMWRALLGPLGIVVAIQGAIAAIDWWNNRQTKAEKDVRSFGDAIAEQTGKFITLTTQINSHTLAQDEQIRAAEELQKLYPRALENYSAEEIAAGKAAGAIKEIAEALIQVAMARTAQEKIDKLVAKQWDLETDIAELRLEATKKQALADAAMLKARTTGSYAFFKIALKAGREAKAAQDELDVLVRKSKNITLQINAIAERIRFPKIFDPLDTGGDGAGAKTQAEKFADLQKFFDQLQELDAKNTEAGIKNKENLIKFKRDADIQYLDDFGDILLQEGILSEDATRILEEARLNIAKKAAADIEELHNRQFAESIKHDQEQLDQLMNHDVRVLEETRRAGETEIEFEARIAKEKTAILLKYAELKYEVMLKSGIATEKELRSMVELINSLKKELEGKPDKKNKGVLAMMGLDLTDAQEAEFLKNIRRIIDSVTDAMQDLNDIQQAQLDKKIKRLEEDRNATEKSIDEQRDLNDQGLANNLDAEVKHLAAIEEQQMAAFERHKQLELQKLNIAAANQAAGLITSSVNIFKTATEIGGPVGVPIAITAIAAMLGAFVAAQAKARALTKAEEPGFAEGGYTGEGGKHDIAGVVHRDEFVMTKENTGKHFDLFEAIHNHEPIPYHALNDLLADTGVVMPNLSPTITNLSTGRAEMHRQTTVTTKDPELLAELKLNRIATEKLLAKADNETIVSGDTVITKKGNHTTIRRK